MVPKLTGPTGLTGLTGPTMSGLSGTARTARNGWFDPRLSLGALGEPPATRCVETWQPFKVSNKSESVHKAID